MHISIENVSLSFGDRSILDGVTIDIPEGKISAIMGPSGSGKTVLLRLMGKQLDPDSGTVKVDNRDLSKLSTAELYALRMQMGVLFQTSALFPDLTVFENVAYPLREHTKLSNDMIRDVVLMKLHAVGLRGARDLLPSQLSGGMQRRVALARAVVFDPQVIFYDDPFSGLDPISIATIMRLIKTLNKSLGVTSVIISHDVDEILEIADVINLIDDGKCIASGPAHMIAKSDIETVQAFITGGKNGEGVIGVFSKNTIPIAQALF